MRLRWRKSRQTMLDRALATNGAYEPPAHYELIDEAAQRILATVQKQATGWTATVASGIAVQFAELERAKDYAKAQARAR